MAPKPLPSRELVQQLLSYDPDTGVFTWLPRPLEMFSSTSTFGAWNHKFAGKSAGHSLPDGYLRPRINNVRYLGHRLAWLWVYGEPVPSELDHIDGDPSNNRIANLRPATHIQNMANSRMPTTNTTGAKGVSLHHRRFRATITIDGKVNRLGSFATVKEAAEARREAAARLHGEFVRHE